MTDTTTPRQAALQAFTVKVQQCQHPGCTTYSLHRLCARHRPPEPAGEWAVAASIKREIEREKP